MEHINTSNKLQELNNLFKTCLNILRNDAEHLIGDEALNELSYFLILKQSEKHIINGSIDIFNLEYYKDCVQEYGEEEFINNLEHVKFSKFYSYVKDTKNENNIKNIFNGFIWDEVLSKHPKFKVVFEQGKKSFIKESQTIKKIVLALGEIDFDNYDLDILGEAYESIFVDAVFGAGGNKKSELGQFFTPPKVKKLLVSLVDPKVKENGQIESVLDPSSGTGGILNTVIKHYSSKIHDKDNLRNQLIDKIYGIEIKGKIFNLCMSNMLINTGEILPKVICADSIRTFHDIKVDNIIANPPFSVTMKYEDLLSSLGSLEILDDYIPIKTGGKNSEMLFLQMMIHCLNINGRCATVMLDGQKIYGSSSGYDKVREYLMRSCDLHEVILCPGGTFTSTGSKTCILFFTKKKERADVLEITGTKRNLKFLHVKNHATENVKFYNFNLTTGEKEFIKEVSIEEIANRKYSLNHNEYQIIEEMKKVIGNIEWKELGEVCEKIKGCKRNSKDALKDGLYPFYYCSILGNLSMNTYDYTDEGVIINKTNGSGKSMVYYYKGKYSVGESTIHFKSSSEYLNTKYVYYYLFLNLNKLEEYYKGSLQKSITDDDLFKFKIPIPSIESQKRIVKYLDDLENQTIQMYQQIDFYKNSQGKYLDLFLETLKKSEWKELGEVCKVNQGTYITKDLKIKGDYPVYGGGDVSYYINQYNREDEIIIAKDGISINCVRYVSNKFFLNHHAWTITCNDIVIKKYLYFYLNSIQDKIYNLSTGAAQKGINQDNFYKIKIPIPSLEKQKEIVNYLDSKNDIIKQIEKEIENNKIIAHTFLQDIITHIEEEQTERVKEDDEDILLIETEEVVPTVKPKLKLKVKKQEISSVEDDSISVSGSLSSSSSSSSPSCKHIFKDGRKCETIPKKNPNYCSKHCK